MKKSSFVAMEFGTVSFYLHLVCVFRASRKGVRLSRESHSVVWVCFSALSL